MWIEKVLIATGGLKTNSTVLFYFICTWDKPFFFIYIFRTSSWCFPPRYFFMFFLDYMILFHLLDSFQWFVYINNILFLYENHHQGFDVINRPRYKLSNEISQIYEISVSSNHQTEIPLDSMGTLRIYKTMIFSLY